MSLPDSMPKALGTSEKTLYFVHERDLRCGITQGKQQGEATVAPVAGDHRRCGHRQEDSMHQYSLGRWVFVSR
jgi:hypothetical protein